MSLYPGTEFILEPKSLNIQHVYYIGCILNYQLEAEEQKNFRY